MLEPGRISIHHLRGKAALRAQFVQTTHPLTSARSGYWNSIRVDGERSARRMFGRKMERKLDCPIVGAGPAGLTAAIYLARFHLSIGIVDAGQSRAALSRARAITPATLGALQAANSSRACATRP
jgi:hypothetical protein